MHWADQVNEAISRSDLDCLMFCTTGVEFCHFERLLIEYITSLVKDPWEISFRVYNGDMSADFEVK